MELRMALEQIWDRRHRRRRNAGSRPVDDLVVASITQHDVECYCGVTQLRKREHVSPFCYSAWWLTVDQMAFDLKDELRQRMNSELPDSPVMSADFMVNYLASGLRAAMLAKPKS